MSEQILSQKRGRNFARNLTVGVTLGGVVAAGIGYALYKVNEADQADQHRRAGIARQLDRQIALDGFSAQVDKYAVGDGTAGVDLQVTPNCRLNGVYVDYSSTDGQVTDVYNYSFTAVTYPKLEERNVGTHRRETYITGQETVFTFQNREDLETHVLGSIPCSTLAGNLDLQQQYPQ